MIFLKEIFLKDIFERYFERKNKMFVKVLDIKNGMEEAIINTDMISEIRFIPSREAYEVIFSYHSIYVNRVEANKIFHAIKIIP